MHKTILSFTILALLLGVFIGLYFYTDIEEYQDSHELNTATTSLPKTTEKAEPETPKTEDTLTVEPEATKQEIIEIVEETTSQPNLIEELEEIDETPPKQDVVLEQIVNTVEESSNLSFAEINTETRKALVNIFCLTKGYSSNISPISGSGTIIDERGVILTNAHIAQHFLLKDYPTENFVNCLIRTGSPARAMYKAKLIHLSPTWIEENSKALTTENPTGTGEHDFAFLLIDEALNGSTLPEYFDFVEIESDESTISQNDDVLIAGYPAGLLGSKTVQKDLYASSAIGSVVDLFTFETGALDVLSLGGTVVAQKGSSGGAVVNKRGKMIGLISTSSDGDTTADRDLRAISISHIERSLSEHSSTTINELLSENLNQKAAVFNETTAETLLQILISTFLNN